MRLSYHRWTSRQDSGLVKTVRLIVGDFRLGSCISRTSRSPCLVSFPPSFMTVGRLQGLAPFCSNVPVRPALFFDLLAVLMQLPSHVPTHFRSRFTALRPGGPVSTRFFGTNPTVLQVGSTVFVHGGLLPGHVDYGLDRISEYASIAFYGMKPKVSQSGDCRTTQVDHGLDPIFEHVVISIAFFEMKPQGREHGVCAGTFLPGYVDCSR